MTLYEYIKPILKKYPDKKCILYDNKAIGYDVIYTGKIGDIPSRYLVYIVTNIKLGDMNFWHAIVKDIQKTDDILRIWITDIKDINSELGILGGV